MKQSAGGPNPYLALLVYLSAIVLGLLALDRSSLFFVPIFAGFVLAFLLNPLLFRLRRLTGMSRGACAAFLVVLLFLSLFSVLTPLLPYLLGRLTAAAEKLPVTLALFSDKVDVFNTYLLEHFPAFVGKIDLMKQVESSIQNVLGHITDHVFELFSNLYGVVHMLAFLVLIPLFTFFFLRDYYIIKSFVFSLVPEHWTDYFRAKLVGFNQILSSYIRGQAIVVIILCVFYSIGLSFIGLPFPVVIGIFSGLGDIIPYFGTIIGLLISLIVGFVHFHSIEQTLLILAVFLVIKVIENWFIYPKIVGGKVGLHFIWVLLAIIGFGKLFGFWGLLVAIPSSGGIKLFLLDAYHRYRASRFFLKEKGEGGDQRSQ